MKLNTLFNAAIAGDADARTKLLMQAEKLNEYGETILHTEAENGNAERVRFILREFAHKNLLTKITKYKHTALHLAIYNGHTKVAAVLIDAARDLPPSFQAFLRQGDKDGDTALHAAVTEGNVAIVKLLVEADPTDTHIQNRNGKTPMYIAVEKGFQEIVEIISTTCRDPSLDGPNGSSVVRIDDLDQVKSPGGTLYKIMDRDALFAAAIDGDADAIAKLEMQADKLDYSTDRHIQNRKGKTPMYIAVEKGYNHIVEIISTTCTAPSLDGHYGRTILHTEAKNGNAERVRFILREFAHKNLLVKLNRYKRTALHLAALYGHTEVAEVLIDAARHLPNDETHDNPVTSFQARHLPPSSANDDTPVTSFQAFLRQGDKDMDTALHIAVKKGQVDIVKLLVEADPADRHIQNSDERTPIFIAAEKGYNDIVQVICTTCTDASLDGTTASHAVKISNINEAKRINKDVIRVQINALILAIKRRDKDSVLRQLHNAKHIATFEDDKGWTSLHYAAFHEFDSVLNAIIEAQKDMGYHFIYKDRVQTPLLVAAEKGYTSTVIRLMELWPTSSPAYTAINNDRRNILHLAAAENKKEMIQGILKHCPKKYKDKILKQQDVNGDTPLHLLISHGCYIPELIKHRGLDTMVRNKRRWTPRDMLYFTDDIIADQVKIKIALDDVQTKQSRKFWRGNMRKIDILESSVVLPSKREKKDEKFNKEAKLAMDEKRAQTKKDLERYKKRTSTQIVVATLITTVTFTVGFTMPGGVHQSGEVDEGLVVLTKKAAFNAFMVSDALAFLLSTCSLFLYFLESMYEDPHQVSKLNAASVGLNIVSVMAMMLTFITGTYVVLSHSAAIAITVCLIGSFFFIFVIVLLIKMVYDRQVKRNED